MSITERIKQVREMFCMNKTEFARLVGITMSLISQMELGRANVSWKTSHLLEEKLFISQRWLHYGEGGMFIRDDITVETVLNLNPDLKKICEYRMALRNAVGEKGRGKSFRVLEQEQMRKEAAGRLKRIRDAFDINQNQLAKRLGYTRAYISAVEKGLERPSQRMAEMIEAEFGVSAEWLLYGNAA